MCILKEWEFPAIVREFPKKKKKKQTSLCENGVLSTWADHFNLTYVVWGSWYLFFFSRFFWQGSPRFRPSKTVPWQIVERKQGRREGGVPSLEVILKRSRQLTMKRSAFWLQATRQPWSLLIILLALAPCHCLSVLLCCSSSNQDQFLQQRPN